MTPKERPILFRDEMVRAILAGIKTQTRRPFKTQPKPGPPGFRYWTWQRSSAHSITFYKDCPYDPEMLEHAPHGRVGDRLWVRETWMVWGEFKTGTAYAYRADGDRHGNWGPSIFMPRKASRITLEITSVRFEQLGDISEEDALAEGIRPERFDDNPLTAKLYADAPTLYPNYSGRYFCRTALESYQSLWEKIHGKGTWGPEQWVWVYTFKRITE